MKHRILILLLALCTAHVHQGNANVIEWANNNSKDIAIGCGVTCVSLLAGATTLKLVVKKLKATLRRTKNPKKKKELRAWIKILSVASNGAFVVALGSGILGTVFAINAVQKANRKTHYFFRKSSDSSSTNKKHETTKRNATYHISANFHMFCYTTEKNLFIISEEHVRKPDDPEQYVSLYNPIKKNRSWTINNKHYCNIIIEGDNKVLLAQTIVFDEEDFGLFEEFVPSTEKNKGYKSLHENILEELSKNNDHNTIDWNNLFETSLSQYLDTKGFQPSYTVDWIENKFYKSETFDWIKREYY